MATSNIKQEFFHLLNNFFHLFVTMAMGMLVMIVGSFAFESFPIRFFALDVSLDLDSLFDCSFLVMASKTNANPLENKT